MTAAVTCCSACSRALRAAASRLAASERGAFAAWTGAGAWVEAAGAGRASAVGGEGKGGLLDGNPAQLGVQVMGVVATLVYSGVVSFIILKVLDVVMGLRPDEHTEAQGLDITAHGERAYVGDGAD